MSVTPTGSLSLPLVAVRDALVAAAAFVSWVAPAAAADCCYLIEEPAEGAGTKFAVVDWGFDCSREVTDLAPGSTFEQSGNLLVAFRWTIPEGTSDEDATLTFLNMLGAIMPQLEVALWNARIALQACRLIAGPERTPIADRRKFDMYEAIWSLEAKEWPT